MVLDRYSAYATGRNRYFLRPIWDARRAVRALPGGGCALVRITDGRRNAATLMPLDDVELLLSRWSEPKPYAPARLPWQAGVVAASAGMAK
jgi:hypothetical protein